MTVATSPKITPELHTEICQFLYREARTLDENRFEDWLDMLTEDVAYDMPLTLTRERSELDRAYEPEMQYYAENIHSLKMRVARLRTEYAWAEDPPTRTTHMVLNVELETGEDQSEVLVHSAFLVFANRGPLPDWEKLIGRRVDVLVREGSDWKIRRRTLYLDQATLGANTISVFL